MALFFGLSYTLLAAHYLSFDHKAKQDELREISKITRANLASSFSLKEQKGFVYDK
ncbi:hypothetical protein [Campylobacter concisus]|uniref:hypothetical protein n=1 Tax=Campylobacter concisus TaxID=199 RepID=UPI001CB7E129|nr:hypothetical protein [Campylobacter concisus]